MKQTIFQIFVGVFLMTALACTKYEVQFFGQSEPTALPTALGATYKQFRCNFGNEVWLATDSTVTKAATAWMGLNGTVYGLECDGTNPITMTDLTTLATWSGGELPVPLMLEGFTVVSQFSSQWVVSNVYPITLGTLEIPSGSEWSLSKTLNDESEATAEEAFNSFFLQPQIGPNAPVWFFLKVEANQ